MTDSRELVRLIFLFVGVCLLFGVAYGIFLAACRSEWCALFEWQRVRLADSFAKCEALGFPVAESYPRQCHAGKKSFTEPRVAP
jgi:hypothetical protein